MDDLTMWSLIVGFVSPLVISLVQQPGWSKRLRALVTFGASVLLGAGTAYFQGDLDSARSTVSAILIVLVAGVSTYQSLWKQTGLAPSIEAATSRSASAVADLPVTEPTVVEKPEKTTRKR